MHERVPCCDKAANHQFPIAADFWIIPINSAKECSSLMQNLMYINSSTCTVFWNVMTTQYTCSFNGTYCPHWLVEWSHHCSHMDIPIHSSCLLGYTEVVQTILIILTMAGLFPDRHHTCCLSPEFFSCEQGKNLTGVSPITSPWLSIHIIIRTAAGKCKT